MDAAQTLREARRSAGTSQRALARLSGVGARTIAAIESETRQPTVATLARLLAACGQSLTARSGTGVHPDACTHLRTHLGRSLTERWEAAADRTGRARALHAALASTVGDLVLEPAAAVALWVPGVHLALPLVAEAHVLPGSGPRTAPDPALLVLRPRPAPLPPGLVRVRVRTRGTLDLHGLPPADLARQHACRAWAPALTAAAALLHGEQSRDDGGRRSPPHRQPDEDEEARRLSHSLRYTGRPRPDARDSRALRLGAPVSLPQWLEQRGLPPLLGQRPGRALPW